MKKIVVFVLVLVMVASMAASAFAAESRPSVTQKEAPDGDYEILNEDGELEEIPDGSIIVTPLSEKNTTSFVDVRDSLEQAENDLVVADTLEDLHLSDGDLQEIVSCIGSDVKVDDLIVSDLFNVKLTGTYEDLFEKTKTLKIAFDLGLEDDDFLPVVLMRDQDEQWHIVGTVSRAQNGIMLVTLNYLGTLAFVTVADDVIVEDPDHHSPQTNADFESEPAVSVTLALAASAVVCGAAYMIVKGFFKKKSIG